jgi:Fe(3+) dicitrate transport protein
LTSFLKGYAIIEQNSITSGVPIALTKINNLSGSQKKQNDKMFALHKLKDIEGTAIYAGKKLR